MKKQALTSGGVQGRSVVDGGEIMHSQQDLQPHVSPLRFIFFLMAFMTLFMGAAAVMAMQ